MRSWPRAVAEQHPTDRLTACGDISTERRPMLYCVPVIGIYFVNLYVGRIILCKRVYARLNALIVKRLQSAPTYPGSFTAYK